jgi:hypothetical protein
VASLDSPLIAIPLNVVSPLEANVWVVRNWEVFINRLTLLCLKLQPVIDPVPTCSGQGVSPTCPRVWGFDVPAIGITDPLQEKQSRDIVGLVNRSYNMTDELSNKVWHRNVQAEKRESTFHLTHEKIRTWLLICNSALN